MYGEHHPLPYQSKIKEKFVSFLNIRLTLVEFAWWIVGISLSTKLMKIIPPIGNDWMFSHIHQFIPFYITLLIAHGRHPRTGLSLAKYLILMVMIRFRRRKFTYRKVNTAEGGDRLSTTPTLQK